jgi:hypothetical protein
MTISNKYLVKNTAVKKLKITPKSKVKAKPLTKDVAKK